MARDRALVQEAKLADVLSELAGTPSKDFPIQGILDQDVAVIAAVTELAHVLELTVAAEGVETGHSTTG